MSYLPSSYDPTMVVASVLIGGFASYVALDLAKRSRSRERLVAVGWWACGSGQQVTISGSVGIVFFPDHGEKDKLVTHAELLCEITESVAMEDVKAMQRTFEGLAGIGVFLSIDDFGTGYSSLSYLRQLPADQLKIDRSFVNDLDSSTDARAVVDAVIRLAHALGLKVVAEGVETAAQRDILRELGCDELQGFFFAKPMPANALLAWKVAHELSGAVTMRSACPAALNIHLAAGDKRSAPAEAAS